MTEQQELAFGRIPTMHLVAPTVTKRRGVLVRLDRRLFVLSPSGLLHRWKDAA